MVVTKFFTFEEILFVAYKNDSFFKKIPNEKSIQSFWILDQYKVNISFYEIRRRKCLFDWFIT